MDAGRFGKALGVGAREAAKAAMRAAEAAAAPSPTPQARPSPRPATPVVERAAVLTAKAMPAAQNLKRGGKKFGEAVWSPFARLSGVLILEVTGVLFGMFALVAALEAWKGRTSLHPSAPQFQHEIFALIMLAVFGYFTASSFLRASRRGRR